MNRYGRVSKSLLQLGCLLFCGFLAQPTIADEGGPPTLAIGAAAPEFCLPGIDGQNHCLKDYSSANVLVLAFTCNHCPTAQLYESRIKQLAEDYRDRGVTVVAIQPNNPKAVRLDEMGYTDVGDSFEDMKTRCRVSEIQFSISLRRRNAKSIKRVRAHGHASPVHLRLRAQTALRRQS